MSLIEIEHLKYKYPNTDRLVLNDISLTIEKGEFIGIVGRNGAGKSTLMKTILGLRSPMAGRISFGDGLKHNEIAKILDKPLSTVLSRYNRAIKKLQKYA